MFCENCGKEIKVSSNFCNYCGVKIEKETRCPKCSEIIEENSVFCSNCGNKIKQEPIKVQESERFNKDYNTKTTSVIVNICPQEEKKEFTLWELRKSINTTKGRISTKSCWKLLCLYFIIVAIIPCFLFLLFKSVLTLYLMVMFIPYLYMSYGIMITMFVQKLHDLNISGFELIDLYNFSCTILTLPVNKINLSLVKITNFLVI